jgi:Cu/Zn superoxide dismutase
LTPGFHGIHIHEYGDLSPDQKGCCESVCLHYNPTQKQHGSFALYGLECHAGDLCNNVLANKHGHATYTFQYIPGHNKMFDIEDILGRSIVVHANKDDLGVKRDSDPNGSGKTGNAGQKLACAVIGRMKPLTVS